VLATPPPPVTGGELWVDCSNYTGNLTDQGCADLKAAGYVGVIIQAITGLDGVSYTRQQLAACVRNGLRIAGYVWCFPFAAPGSMLTRLGMFDGYRLEFLALDVEEAGTRKFDVDRDLALCDAYTTRLPVTWIYTGKWFFDQQHWSQETWWSWRPLWNSLYDHTPVANDHFVPYHGWTKAVIEQYRGTSSVGHVAQIDLNVTA
jgi:hypothetical protein